MAVALSQAGHREYFYRTERSLAFSHSLYKHDNIYIYVQEMERHHLEQLQQQQEQQQRLEQQQLEYQLQLMQLQQQHQQLPSHQVHTSPA